MPRKKKEPTLRWKAQPLSWRDLWRPKMKLQQWDEAQNKYVDVPFRD